MKHQDPATLLMLNAANRHYGIDIEYVLRIAEFDGMVTHPPERSAGPRDRAFHPLVDMRSSTSALGSSRPKKPFLIFLREGLLPWGLVVDDAWGSLCYEESLFDEDQTVVEEPAQPGICLRKVTVKDSGIESEFYLVMPELLSVQ